jgi:putative FmdB family regulatory protein
LVVTYEHTCKPCGLTFDVIKTVSEIDRPEPCPDCGGQTVRHFAPRRVFFSGTSVQDAEYNPGLGCVVKNKEHRAEIAKQKGLVEVGNDYKSGEHMQAKFDQDRAERKKRIWEDA